MPSKLIKMCPECRRDTFKYDKEKREWICSFCGEIVTGDYPG